MIVAAPLTKSILAPFRITAASKENTWLSSNNFNDFK